MHDDRQTRPPGSTFGSGEALGQSTLGQGSPEAPLPAKWTDFEIPRLVPADSQQAFDIHLAAIEWGLDPAILITSAEDIQGRAHWSEVFEPYEHQVRNLLTFCRRAPVALVADDVGLGKTITAGLIISELVARRKVERVLVLAPKILLPQWKEELESKFRIPTDIGSGSDASRFSNLESGAFVTTYDSARSRLGAMAEHGFDMIVMDEAHKLRNLFGPQGPPRLAVAVQEALKKRAFRYVLMLTATPIQNRLWDMYSLVDLLCTAKGHANPLGNPDGFAQRYLADSRTTARQLNPGRKDEFRRHLSQYVVRARRHDCGLHFPTRHVLARRTPPTPGEESLLDLVRALINDLNGLTQASVAQALMSSPAALVNQLGNMAARGSIPEATARRAERIAQGIDQSSKLTALLDLIKELRLHRPADWRVVVFTGRKATQDYIGHSLAEELADGDIGYIRGGAARENERAIGRYRASPPTCHVIVSTDTGAEGVNLQAGNVLVNYDLPWNPMILEQRIGRVQRLGTEHEYVTVYNLVLAGSIEERVVARITEKLLAVTDTLGDIEGILEAVGNGQASEASESMERKIQELVVLAIQGRDVERATQQAHDSIERAKAMYEQEKEQVETNLGSLDRMHDEGPRMPRLSQTEPRLSERDFTLQGLAASGTQLTSIGDDLWSAQRAGHALRYIAFQRKRQDQPHNDTIGGGITQEVYRAGSPPFERLVGQWNRAAEHHVVDHTSRGHDESVQLVREWCAQFEELTIEDIRRSPCTPEFHGQVTAQVGVAVSHDKYEKLIEIPVGDNDKAVEFAESAPAKTEFRLSDVSPEALDNLKPHIESDSDVRAFAEFYSSRLMEDLARAGDDEDRRMHVQMQFDCSINARVVAAKGVVTANHEINALASLDGAHQQTLRFIVDAPGADLLAMPTLERCSVSHQPYPVEFMASCEISGARALLKNMVTSELSGRLVTPSAAGQCAETLRMLAADELETDATTGRCVGRDLLVPSDVSERKTLESNLATCEITGARCLPDELVISAVSGRRFRRDQERVGGTTGVLGHTSEFEQCQLSLEWLLPTELISSDASGTRFDHRRAVRSERVPQRIGMPNETVTCQATGRLLLMDEVVQSAVSGKWLDDQLAVRSAESQQYAMPDELVVCVVSGRKVLPSETEECSVSGQRALPGFMVRSATSGAWALPTEVVTSPETGRVVLRTEARHSDVSGFLIPLDEGAECSVTQAFGEISRMTLTDYSGSYALPRHVVTSLETGRTCTAKEAIKSAWTGIPLLPDEAAQCAWTQILCSKLQVDADGVFIHVREFIQDRKGGQAARPSAAHALRANVFSRLVGKEHHLDELVSPSEQMLIVRSARARVLSSAQDVRSIVYQRSSSSWKPKFVVDAQIRGKDLEVVASHGSIGDLPSLPL